MIRQSRLSKFFLVAGFLAMLAIVPQSIQAQQTDDDTYRENTEINQMFHKLGRGVSNVLLGWVEVPKNIAKEWRRTEPFTGTIVGFFKGFGWAVARTVAGVYEVISFPFPVPKNYEPIMYPEFVMPSVWGERLPIYSDEFLASEANQSAAISSAGDPTYGNTYDTVGSPTGRSY